MFNLLLVYFTINVFAVSAFTYIWKTNTPQRMQWDNNYGYCGGTFYEEPILEPVIKLYIINHNSFFSFSETSTIVAGLKYGQYISQFDMRILGNAKDQASSSSQLLLGVNDNTAAQNYRLNFVQNNQQDTSSTHAQTFLAWVKSQVRQGNAVTIAIFYAGGTDSEYDHIVPVHSVQSNYNDNAYHADDVITFNDNYLTTDCGPYTFASFQGTRRSVLNQCGTGSSASYYALPSEAGIASYGIALTGVVKGSKDVLLPVRVTVNKNAELPVIQDGSNTRPAASQIVLTVTVSNVTNGVRYSLYKYTSTASVPTANFNQQSSSAAAVTLFIGSNTGFFAMNDTILSSATAVYRCVQSTVVAQSPSTGPTKAVTATPTTSPSKIPTSPTPYPTTVPPTPIPIAPSTAAPSFRKASPTTFPTTTPSLLPSTAPTARPTGLPSRSSSQSPTETPALTVKPTTGPSSPTATPSTTTAKPTSRQPTSARTSSSSFIPSAAPQQGLPSIEPTPTPVGRQPSRFRPH